MNDTLPSEQHKLTVISKKMNIKFNCTLSTIIHTVNPKDISVFQIYLHVSVLCAVFCAYCFYWLMSAGPNAHFTVLFTAYN